MSYPIAELSKGGGKMKNVENTTEDAGDWGVKEEEWGTYAGQGKVYEISGKTGTLTTARGHGITFPWTNGVK